MKAQLTIEFLGIFLLTIVFFSVLMAGMSALKSKSEYSAYLMERTVELEGVARTLDAYSNCGIAMVFNLETSRNKVQNNTVMAEEKGRTLVVEGVFNEVTNHVEPI